MIEAVAWWIMVMAPVAFGVIAVAAYVLGFRRGSAPSREEERQREIERRLTGRRRSDPDPTAEPAVIRRSRFHGSKRWAP